jgi:hypothetical protein
MSTLLEGVRQDDAAGEGALAADGRVAYRVLPDPTAFRRPGDKRGSQRQRARLSSAKLLDANNRFLCDCLIRDRSSSGLRLTLAKAVSLPPRCHFFDDDTGDVTVVAVVWRRDPLVGLRICANASAAISPRERAALRGRYYAMVD